MHRIIPVKNLVPNMLNCVDYNKLINNIPKGNQSHNTNKEIKGRTLKLNKRINNYRNKTF